MKCHDIQALLVPYLLDEIESSQRTEIEMHLTDCEPCRKDLAARSATVQAVRKLPDHPTSALRRERAVAAMAEESRSSHGSRSATRFTRILRSPLTLAAAAALVVVAFLPLFTVGSHEQGPAFRVTGIKGRAFVHRQNRATWESLTTDALVGEGDWVITEIDSMLDLTSIEDRITVDGNSSLKIGATSSADGVRDIIIEKGQIYGKVGGATYRIVNTNNDQIVVSRGEFEAGVRYAVCVGSTEPESRRKSLKQGAVAFNDVKVADVVAAIRKLTNRRIEQPQGISAEKKITFHSDATDPERLMAEFETSLERQGFALVRATEASFKLIPVSRKQENWSMARRMYVRMGEGTALLRGSKGEIAIGAGEEGGIDGAGYPVHRPRESAFLAVWRNRPDDGGVMARNTIPMPSIEINYVGTAEDGRPVVRYSLSASAVTAQFGDRHAEIFVAELSSATVKLDETTGEIIVPVRVRVAFNK